MGVNLFAWIGGFVLFLAAAFFVKYSIDNNLISPEIRVAIGLLLGAGLLVAGLRMSGKDYKVTAHTLCATGIVILYADIFAAHAFYGFIGQPLAFLFMILTTSAAILLAIRLEAKVVAILGLLGGFLTPPLLSTGQDHPLGLFGYVAFLDAGLILVALKKPWSFLVILAAAGTVAMQIGWANKFFEVSKVFVSMGIFFTFQAVFLGAFLAAVKRDLSLPAFVAAAILMPATTLGFLSYFLSLKELGVQPLTLFLFGLVSDLCLIGLVIRRPSLLTAHRLAGLFLFFLLAAWTFGYLSQELLYRGLALYMVFAILHAAFPLLLQRLHPELETSTWDQLFGLLALALTMIPVLRLGEISLGFWCAVLLLDGLIVWIAMTTASVGMVIAALIMTMLSILSWMLRMPMTLAGLPEFILVTAAFAAIFFGIGAYAAKTADSAVSTDSRAQPRSFGHPAFLLLILATLHLPLDNPSPIFGLALLLAILLLGLSRMLKIAATGMIALLCVVTLEYTWHVARFKPETAVVPLIWYMVFYALFAFYPFLFRKALQEEVLPWATSALSGPLHFYMIYKVVSAAYPNSYMGLLPAVFSIPSFAGLIQRLRALPKDSGVRNSQLAWFGGIALFFITLIFPVQFEREWILIGWALEGTALLWLFHRVPHPGLRVVGVGLLVVPFLGLANPGFFMAHARSLQPIFNWYLYTYGIVTASLMVGAKLLDDPRNKIGSLNVQPLLYALGTLLAFLLMNIEIAELLLGRGHSCVPVFRQFRPRHDVFDCLGLLCFWTAHHRHPQEHSVRPVWQHAVAGDHPAKALPPRSCFAEAALSRRSAGGCCGDSDPGVLPVPAVCFLRTRAGKRMTTMRTFLGALISLAVFLPACVGAQAAVTEWKFRQDVRVDQPGLLKIDLPVETLDAARSGLEDLRICDASGNEVPYLVERVHPQEETVFVAKRFQVLLEKDSSVIFVETDLDRPVDAIEIETSAGSFIKAVQVNGSNDRNTWKLLLTGAPIYRDPRGEERLQLGMTQGTWKFLRITIDDSRSEPIPISGIRLHPVAQPAPENPVAVRIRDRKEDAGATRLELDFGARNLRDCFDRDAHPGAVVHAKRFRAHSPDPRSRRPGAVRGRRNDQPRGRVGATIVGAPRDTRGTAGDFARCIGADR